MSYVANNKRMYVYMAYVVDNQQKTCKKVSKQIL